jgi:hypothetical protein
MYAVTYAHATFILCVYDLMLSQILSHYSYQASFVLTCPYCYLGLDNTNTLAQ